MEFGTAGGTELFKNAVMTNMKYLKILTLLFFALFCAQKGQAQTVNWGNFQQTKHLVFVETGWEHGLIYGVAYGYQLHFNIPVLLNAHVSIPSGTKLFDDLKVKTGAQVVFLNKPNLKGSIALNGVFRTYESPLVRLANFGSEMKGTLGYFKPKWFVAGEFGFDKAIVTHFKHSDSFRENIYQAVQDGWYEPATGGNFLYGIQTGLSRRKFDLSLRIGKVVTQDFKTTPLLPYYLGVGVGYKIW